MFTQVCIICNITTLVSCASVNICINLMIDNCDQSFQFICLTETNARTCFSVDKYLLLGLFQNETGLFVLKLYFPYFSRLIL